MLRRRREVNQWMECPNDRRANVVREAYLLAETGFSDSVGWGETY